MSGLIVGSTLTSAQLAASEFGPFTNLASAATTSLGSINTIGVNITGSVTITSFGSGANLFRVVTFAAALTLTHNATSLILPGAANIVTMAGSRIVTQSDASGNWWVMSYTSPQAGFVTIDASNTNWRSGSVSYSWSSGTNNTYVGYLAGSRASISSNNTSVGYAAGYGNGMGGGNTNVGANAGQQLGSAATNNTNVGYLAGQNISSGTDNMTFGHQAGNGLTTGSGNTLIGKNAGNGLTTGSYAVYVGSAAGQSATKSGVGIGQGALAANTGDYNVAIGRLAGTKITTGGSNVAIGDAALSNSLTAQYCIAIGKDALLAYADGGAYNGNSIAIGFNVLGSCLTGWENVGIGTSVLGVLTSGAENTAVGIECMSGATTANRNVAMGVAAMKRGTTAYNCVAMGYGAGDGDGTTSNTTGHDNTYLGYGAVNASATQRNFQTIIGASAIGVNDDNAITLGRIGTDSVYAGLALLGLKDNAGSIYTVAQLPPASTAIKGARSQVSDALAPTWMGALTGGGSVVCPVFCNGSTWVPG